MKRTFSEEEIEDILRRYRPPVSEVFKKRLKGALLGQGKEIQSGEAERLKAVLEDENLLKELLATRTPLDAQSWLSDHDVDLEVDDIRVMLEMLTKISKGEISSEQFREFSEGELGEDELEAVAAGNLTRLDIGMLVNLALAGRGITDRRQ